MDSGQLIGRLIGGVVRNVCESVGAGGVQQLRSTLQCGRHRDKVAIRRHQVGMAEPLAHDGEIAADGFRAAEKAGGISLAGLSLLYPKSPGLKPRAQEPIASLPVVSARLCAS